MQPEDGLSKASSLPAKPATDIKVPDELKQIGGKLKMGFLKALGELDKATAGTRARAKGEQLLRAARRPGAWKELLNGPDAKAPLPIEEIKERVARAMASEQADSRLRARVAVYVAGKAAGGSAVASDSVEALHGALGEYVARVPALIEAASAGAAATDQTARLNPVLHIACRVFLMEDDLIPASEGLYGLIDNAYLTVGVLEAASAEHAARTGKPLFDLNLSAANAGVRELLGPEQAAALDARLEEIKDHEAFRTAVKYAAIAAGVAVAAILLGSALNSHPEAGRLIARGAARKFAGGIGGPDAAAGAVSDAASGVTGGPGSWGACTEDEIARLTAEIGLLT